MTKSDKNVLDTNRFYCSSWNSDYFSLKECQMKIREFLKFYLGYNSFQVVSESGDRWTDVLSKEEVLKSFENAELKRTDIDGEEYICWLVLFTADKDFKE